MFDRLGRVVPRLRLVFVLIWLVAAGLALFAPSLSSVGSADETSFLPKNAESLTARQVIDQSFPSDAAQTTAQIVFERKTGLTATDEQYIDGLKPTIQAVDGVARYVTARDAPLSGLTSPDGQMEMAVVDLDVPAFQPAANGAIETIRAELHASAPAGLTAQVTGQAGIGRDYMAAIREGTDRTTIATIALVVIVLLLIYRAPLAALVPLITIGLAFVVSRGVLGFLASRGWALSSVLDSFIVVLVFGVGTDYTIFLISRFREELATAPPNEAIRRTVGRIGAVITASAATVIVGLSAMIVARFGMIQTTGPALAVTIFITLLAGLSLTPSLLSIFGTRLFWSPIHLLRHQHRHDPDAGAWAAFARLISNHARIASLVVLAALAVPLLALPQLKQSFDVPSELPAGAESRQGFETLGNHLGKGQLLPLEVLVKVPGANLASPDNLTKIDQLVDRLKLSDVSIVRSPTDLRPSSELPSFARSFRKAPSPDINVQLGNASLAGIKVVENYLGGLASTFPTVASSQALTGAIQDATALDQGLVATRAQALVANQLSAIDDKLQLASTNPSSGDASELTTVKSYLDELGTAYPDVKSQSAYTTALQAIPKVASSRDQVAYIQLVESIRKLSAWFKARPTPAYFSPKSVPPSQSAIQAAQAMAAARQRLPDELDALASSFSAADMYVPPTPSGAAASIPGTDLRSTFLSPSGDVVQLFVVTRSDPYQTAAFDTVRQIRSVLADQRSSFGPDAQAYLGGATAEFADIQTTMSEDFVLVAAFTIAGILLVLILLLRALAAPLYLVATVLLSYLTSLSLSALILQKGMGQPGINYFIPLMVFVLLVALGSDYNIFLMARVREEAATRGLRPGIRVASARTGTVITSAGLILAGTFGALVSSPLQLLFQVGVAVALGVLIDTFIVRSLLVPAITTVFGRWAWWPSRLGTAVTEPAAGATAGAAAGAAAIPASASAPVQERFVPVEPVVEPSAVETNGHVVAPIVETAPVDVTKETPTTRSSPEGSSEVVRSRSVIGGAVATIVRVVFRPGRGGDR